MKTVYVAKTWALGKPNRVGLGVTSSKTAFHEVRFRLVSGKASRAAVDKATAGKPAR